jgi:hypothetical protein
MVLSPLLCFTSQNEVDRDLRYSDIRTVFWDLGRGMTSAYVARL